MTSPARDITVVVTPPGATESGRIGQVMAAWAQAGFVRRFLWWDGEDDNHHRAVWNDDPDTSLSLLDVLAAAPYDVVRLVSLLPVAEPAAGVSTDLPELSSRLEDSVARRLAPSQRLVKLGVVLPATGVARLPRAILSNRWDSTVIVVDEDSVDPAHTSRAVHDPEHFAAHAALALSTVAGLWSGMDDGPFDRDSEAAGQQEPRLRLIRSHARAARGYGLPDEIIRETLTHRTDPAWVADMLGAQPAENSEYLADRAGGEFLTGPGKAMTRTPFRKPPVPRIRMTPKRALRLLWLFMRGRVGELRQDLRRQAVNEVRDRVESFTQRLVFGDDTDFVVRFDGRPMEEDEPGDVGTGSLDIAMALVEAVSRPAAPHVFPAEWRALRDLSFGLVDAGALPEGCTEPLAGVHRQVVAVDAVSPPPDVEEPEGPEPMLVRVGRRIAADADTARREFLQAIETLKANLPGRSVQAPTDRRYWFAWLAVTLVTVAGLTVVITLHDVMRLRDTVYLCVALVVFFLAASGVILFLHLRKEFQEANKANRTWHRYEAARLGAEHEARELIRLAAANATYERWLRVLARMLHVAARDAVTPAPDTTDLETLARPSAFSVASTETDPRLRARLAAIIGRRTFRRGWLSALYTRVVAESMGELKFRRGLPEESPDPDPDVETAAREELAARVADGLADHTVVEDIRTIVSEQTSHLELTELFCAVHPVGGEAMPPATFLGALQNDRAARFNRRLWAETSGYPTAATHTRTWLPERLTTADVPSSTTLLPFAVHADDPVTVVLSARLDQSDPLVWSHLALFSVDEPAPERGAPADIDGVEVW